MRTAFIKQLVEEAGTNDKIFLIVGDLGYSVVETFAEKYPERFLNAGIAEQNMVGVAAGLAMAGYNVYVYSIGNFPTLRCMEQIRYDIAYHKLNVKIVSVGAGYAYGSLGSSHHATEELGMMRTIPNMVVCSPGDPIEAQAITTLSANYDGPMYLRLGKAGEAVVHPIPITGLNIGDLLPVLNNVGSTKALLVSGSILDYAVKRVAELGNFFDVYSVPFIKPLNDEILRKIASEYTDIWVLEEHQKSCGIGSAIIEVISDMYAGRQISNYPRIKRIGIDDTFYSVSGSQAYLRKLAGLQI
ncbi:transketolase family protein [Bacteroides gallinarum]|uniref:transketolase family protein n=1 Tax=Bacteroides gallinarum TaxID=376806 RepID=UPI0003795D0E|nr:transketolase C-terminal domain-containing protein [Bacteroides gallinarum]